MKSLVQVASIAKAAPKPMLPVDQRMGSFVEVEGTITADEVRLESGRCLNCGIYCYDKDDTLVSKSQAADSRSDEKVAKNKAA